MATNDMSNVLPIWPTPRADGGVFSGIVQSVRGASVVVTHEGSAFPAERATGCLIAPEVGDHVLLGAVGQRVFVLTVLEREAGAHELSVDGELTVRARDVRVEAEQGVQLHAGSAATVAARTLSLAAKEGTWVGQQIRMLADQVTVDATRIRQVADFAESVVESAKEVVGRSYRTIRESEHVQAGSLSFRARKMMSLHADSAVLSAKKLVKLAGDQIHLG